MSNRTIPSLVFGLYPSGYVFNRKESKAIELLDIVVVIKVEFERDVALTLFGQQLLQSHCYRDESGDAELMSRRESTNQKLAEAEPDHVGLDQPPEEADVLISALSGESDLSKVSLLSIYLVHLHLLLELDVEKPDCQEVLFVGFVVHGKFVPKGSELF